MQTHKPTQHTAIQRFTTTTKEDEASTNQDLHSETLCSLTIIAFQKILVEDIRVLRAFLWFWWWIGKINRLLKGETIENPASWDVSVALENCDGREGVS